MPLITLETKIYAPIERCFDLSTSIDLHKKSVQFTQEEVIGGRQSGLLQLNEQVTWRAMHLRTWFTMTVKMVALDRPTYFCDRMIQGPFRSLEHEHYFEETKGATLMTDKFWFTSPFGVFGRLADAAVLKNHFTELLLTRNEAIKTFAETDQWKPIIADQANY